MNITCLVPALNSGSNGVQDDGQVEGSRISPPMGALLVQDPAILIVKLGDIVNVAWALRNESTLQDVWLNVVEIVSYGKLLDILDELRLGDANEGILDSAID